MKRARIIGAMSGGLLLVVGALLLALTHSARAATSLSVLDSSFGPSHSNLGLAADSMRSGLLDPNTSPITCTLNTTTTAAFANTTFATAVDLQFSITGLALFSGDKGAQSNIVKNYFRVNNPIVNNAYTVQAIPDGVGNYNLGIIIYDSNFVPITSDQNPLDNNNASITIIPTVSMPIYFEVSQLVPFGNYSCGGTYHLSASQTAPTSTPSLTPTPTPTSTPTKTITPTPSAFACTTGSDRFEPNNDYDTATTLGLGVKYSGLNFVECVQSGDSWDVDYFKARVKPGMLVTCRTLDLTPGTDTNLILYDVSMNGINGSDDINRAAGDLSSSVTYYVTYEGWLYGLVGESFHRPQSEQAAAAYSYECFIGAQSTPTEAPTPTEIPGQPTRTPVPTIPPTPTITLTPSPTPSPTPPFIRIVPLPTATQAGLPAKSIPVSLQVYYDIDSNNKPDPGEGVVGVSARVFDLTNGNLLAQGLTDQTGRVSFTVSAISAVQLVVPYFHFSSIILSSGGSAVIRISPHELPRSIP